MSKSRDSGRRRRRRVVRDRWQVGRSAGLAVAARLVFRASYKTELCPNLLHGCTAEGAGVARVRGRGRGELAEGRGGVFIVNGREMSWPAATCAYGDVSIDSRDLVLIAQSR